MNFRVLVTLCLLLVGASVYAQKSGNEVVYLKNGSVIRGTVLEVVQGKQVKILTADGSIFVYNSSEVERIVKDAPLNRKASSGYTEKRGYIGFSAGMAYSGGMRSIGGYISPIDFGFLLTPNVGIAAKIGARAYDLEDQTFYGQRYDEDISLASMMVGGLLSLPTSKYDRFELKPLIGFARYQLEGNWVGRTLFSWELGGQYRRHLGRTVDFYTGLGLNQVNGFYDWTISFGFGFRLR